MKSHFLLTVCVPLLRLCPPVTDNCISCSQVYSYKREHQSALIADLLLAVAQTIVTAQWEVWEVICGANYDFVFTHVEVIRGKEQRGTHPRAMLVLKRSVQLRCLCSKIESNILKTATSCSGSSENLCGMQHTICFSMDKSKILLTITSYLQKIISSFEILLRPTRVCAKRQSRSSSKY